MNVVPAGTRLVADESLRRFGRVLIGGSPLRLLRLSEGGVRRLDSWLAGEPVGDAPSSVALARRLLDSGIVHPSLSSGMLTPAGMFTPADVTVVIPVKDNDSGVARVREAVGEVASVLVVDDGSASPVPDAKLRHEIPAGPAAARNTGLRLAGTELVAFLDADTVPEPGWLSAVLPMFDDPGVAAVAPRIRSSPGSDVIARYERERSSLDMGDRPAAVRPMSRVGYVPSAALVVRRSVLSDVDGFDEALRFGEDVDLVWRLIAGGHTVRYQPESVVHHEPREDLRSWLRQRFDYGTSAAPLARRHPGLLTPARMSRWSALAWALAAAGRPLSGLAVAVVTASLLPRKLRGVPAAESLRLAGIGHLGAGRLLADATRRAWWPLALLTRWGRRALLLSLLPCLAEAVASPHELDRLRWAALRLADDFAYGAGVWAGCLRHRTIAPLLPDFTEWPGRGR
jgi:mycofactocin system glycosyltransferase